ncbi:hypothetical protein [Maribellus luteus]|uniref:hypothetical protein n=1 Tax=Maribellus luteus TaxID=2305463 RepID=UPI0011C382B0|nr:hypothetical protein [Maribellus luteus]
MLKKTAAAQQNISRKKRYKKTAELQRSDINLIAEKVTCWNLFQFYWMANRCGRGVYLSSRGVPECFAPLGLSISPLEFPTHITATLLLKKTAAAQQNISRKKRSKKQLSCSAAI